MQHFLLHIFSETEPHAHTEEFEGCFRNTLVIFGLEMNNLYRTPAYL